jgi:serine phosphatase RsbU (regulator of sigma subunit)
MVRLAATPATPLGVESPGAPAIASRSLEPGDMLLFYTDGLSEAARVDGTRLGADGLAAFIAREAAGGLSVPETLRRLRHSLLSVGERGLDDDATAILVEWRRGGEVHLLP